MPLAHPATRARVPPEPRRSTSNRLLEVLRRDSGGTRTRYGGVSEGIAGGLMIVIWQPHHKGFSASHWRPGTSVADDSRCLDCAKSLLGVQIHIPGSDRVRSPWRTCGFCGRFQVTPAPQLYRPPVYKLICARDYESSPNRVDVAGGSLASCSRSVAAVCALTCTHRIERIDTEL